VQRETLELRAVRDRRGGAVVFAQWFVRALRLNLHFHALVLDGLYDRDRRFVTARQLGDRRGQAPLSAALRADQHVGRKHRRRNSAHEYRSLPLRRLPGMLAH